MRKNLEYNLNPMKTPTKHGRIECSKMTSFERFGTSVVPSVADISHFKLEILLPNQRCKFEKQYVPPLMNREFFHPIPSVNGNVRTSWLLYSPPIRQN
jgi:hypothetical protein